MENKGNSASKKDLILFMLNLSYFFRPFKQHQFNVDSAYGYSIPPHLCLQRCLRNSEKIAHGFKLKIEVTLRHVSLVIYLSIIYLQIITSLNTQPDSTNISCVTKNRKCRNKEWNISCSPIDASRKNCSFFFVWTNGLSVKALSVVG